MRRIPDRDHPNQMWGWNDKLNADVIQLATSSQRLDDPEYAKQISDKLKTLGINHTLFQLEEGGYQIKIEGVVHCDKFRLQMSEEDWAKLIIGQAYTPDIPAEGATPLHPRSIFPRKPGDEDGIAVLREAFRILQLGDLPTPNKEHRLGSYYPITSPDIKTQIDAIVKEYQEYVNHEHLHH